jgi:hypothetical protein
MSAIKVTLDQDAYIDHSCGTSGGEDEVFYTACATDEDGNKYNVRWEIIMSKEDQEACADGSEICDWDMYTATNDIGEKVVVEIEE